MQPMMMRAVQFAGELSHLTISFRTALVDSRTEHKGKDPLSASRLAALIAESADVQEVWADVSDFPRRDYMTFCAEQAFRAGVTAETLGDWLRPGVRYAVDLLELAAQQIGSATDPAASLLPEMPTEVVRGPVGCYAVSVVCDSTEPEADKILACALLNATADQLNPTPA